MIVEKTGKSYDAKAEYKDGKMSYDGLQFTWGNHIIVPIEIKMDYNPPNGDEYTTSSKDSEFSLLDSEAIMDWSGKYHIKTDIVLPQYHNYRELS